MTRLARVATIAAALSVGVLCVEAQAGPISLAAGTTTNFVVDWTQLVGGEELSAFGVFAVMVDGDSATFLITLTNTTDASLNERVHSVGFGIDPNATSLTDPVQGTVFTNFALSWFPNIQTIDICAYSTVSCAVGFQATNLSGGGASDTFGFTLHGDFGGGLTLNNFAITFQGGSILNPDLTRFTGTATTVPEYESSATFLLVGLGFVVAVGGWRQRWTDTSYR